MLYLATASGPLIREAMASGLIGHLNQPNTSNVPVPGVPWAADNGCFSERWDEGRWLSFLERRRDALPACLFAAVPDVVGDHLGTLFRFAKHADQVRDLGYPVAFVGQDGATVKSTPWDDFDVWFAGGTTDWKLGPALELAAEALERGKRLHMGRVNSKKRFLLAARRGFHTSDGTFLAFGPRTNLPRLRMWIDALEDEGKGSS